MAETQIVVSRASQEDGLGDPKSQALDLEQNFIEGTIEKGMVDTITSERSRFTTRPPIEPLHLNRHHGTHSQGQLMIRNAMAQIFNDRYEPAES